MAEPGVATRPLVAGPPHSVDAVLHAVEAAAVHWRLPDPSVLRMGINGVFVAGHTVLRVSEPTAPAQVSIDLAHVLLGKGVRCPRPASDTAFDAGGGVWVTAWEHVDHGDPSTIDWEEVGATVRTVHDLDPADVPAEHPLPWCSGFPWWHFDRRIETASELIDDAALAAIVACVSRDRWVLDPDTSGPAVVCHGDVHPGNVLAGADGPVLLDWDLLCWGPRGWDHAPLMTWTERWDGREHLYDDFARGYGADLRDDPVAAALSRLRLVAATFGRVDAARTNPDALPELEQRLRWWRGDPHAPRWNPQ